ncbi:MFS transporter [Streptomyces sp. NPDC051776]|uniref:MFS transporter n=1 Tax=Streptomyces sp. NPDC051776 TaxID=3155414 RepID=UPI00342F5E49
MRYNPLKIFGRVPLAGNYPAAVTLALLALCPYLVLTTATSLMRPVLMRELDASAFELQLTVGLSNAGYAFGAVMGADLVKRFPRRRVYLTCESGFTVSTLLALSATDISVFATGMVLQGLTTGVLLVSALPPMILSHGVKRLPTSAAVISVGLFSVTAFGPFAGGLVGTLGGWRLMFTAIAVLAAVGLVVGALTFERNKAPAPGLPLDRLAITCAFGATVLPFFGVAWLTRSSFSDKGFLIPVSVGLLFVVVLVVSEKRASSPLMPVRPISTTLPVTGLAAAMISGASFITLIELVEVYLLRTVRFDDLEVGALLTPALVGVVIAAILFRQLLDSPWVPCLALAGLVSIAVGAALLLCTGVSNASIVVPLASIFLGFGAGSGVTPGLFMAGLSAPAAQIPATFALVELLRSEAAFLIGPALVRLAIVRGIADGFGFSVAIMLMVMIMGAALLVGIYLMSGAALRRPDLEAWLAGTSTAFKSPPVAAKLRKT